MGRTTLRGLAAASLLHLGCLDFDALRSHGDHEYTDADLEPWGDLAGRDPAPRDLSTNADMSDAGEETSDLLATTATNDLANGLANDLSTPPDFASCTTSFARSFSYVLGTSATAIQSGDFNGDGRPDIVVALSGNGGIAVLLGGPDGTLAPAIVDTAVSKIGVMAIGDFNADGDLDVAVGGNNFISLLAGKGDGTFRPPAVVPPYGNLESLSAADVNGDHLLDLIAVSTGGMGGVSTLLNKGAGVFQAQGTYVLKAAFAGLGATADFNGDGLGDFLVGAGNAMAMGNALSYLASGGGDLAAPVTVSAGMNVVNVATGDFNGDGKADAVLVDDAGFLRVRVGDGRGALAPFGDVAVHMKPVAAAVADFNLDGQTDLLSANGGSNDVSLVLNTGRLGFAQATNLAVGDAPIALAVADLDLDGRPDIVVLTSNSSSPIKLLFNTCN